MYIPALIAAHFLLSLKKQSTKSKTPKSRMYSSSNNKTTGNYYPAIQ